MSATSTSPSRSPLQSRGSRLLLMAACLVIVIGGLRVAQPVLVPLLMAAFLTILCAPTLRWLRRIGLPEAVAITLVILGATVVVLAVAGLLGGSLHRFYQELPFYRARLDGIVQTTLAWLAGQGLDISAEELTSNINTGAIMDLAAATAGSLVSAFSNVVLVLVLMAFMLVELDRAPAKLRRAMGRPDADLTEVGRGAEQVQKYLAIKALMSLINSAVAMGICWALDIDFALIWGLLAFLFNFVPNIGSILSGIPPVLLALIVHGPARAALVAALYVSIDFVSGNFIEPRLMGRRLGLSPLVVMASLVFWGWVWGPIGMLLSVPLTSSAKLLLEHSDDLRWVAVMMGTGDELPARGGAPVHPA